MRYYGTPVCNIVLEKRRTNIVFLFLNYLGRVVPANVMYAVAMVFLVFRELANALNNCCFHTENMLFDPES